MNEELFPNQPGVVDPMDSRAREEFPTPRALVREVLKAVVDGGCLDGVNSDPLRVLDICAGWGVWASEMRRLAGLQGWPVHITGVEIDKSKREHLAKWCDAIRVGDWIDEIQEVIEVEPGRFQRVAMQGERSEWDIIIGNPHFTGIVTDDPEDSMPAVLLRHAPAVLLYHPTNTLQRSSQGRAAYRAYTPAHKWLIPGTVAHEGSSTVATDCYQASLWLRGYDGPCTEHLLDAEPEQVNAGAELLKRGGEPYKCWRWRGEAPGAEMPSDDLPSAPGWSP